MSLWRLGPFWGSLELLTREPSTRSSLGGRQLISGLGWCLCCWWGGGEQGGGRSCSRSLSWISPSPLGMLQLLLLAFVGWIWDCRVDWGQCGCLLACHPRSPLRCAPGERIQLCPLQGEFLGLPHFGGAAASGGAAVLLEGALKTVRARQVRGELLRAHQKPSSTHCSLLAG